MNIGQKLKDKRAMAGLTQEAVAEAIGVSRQTISNWENNRSYPDVTSILRLSDLYTVSLDELLKEDANMRKHVEESASLWKTIWNLFYDVSIILLPIAYLFRYYGWEIAAMVSYALSAVLFVVPRLLYPRLLGGSCKIELMRIAAYLMMFYHIAISTEGNYFVQCLGLGLLLLVFRVDKKRGELRKSNAVALTLIYAVPLFILVSQMNLRGEDNVYTPFSHTYRVASVLYAEDESAALPVIRLESYNGLYLDNPWTDEDEYPGDMVAVDVPEGDPETTPKGIWQLIPEDDPTLLYKVTVEADETVILSCQKEDILQWKYRLSRVDTLKISFKNFGSVGGFTARWYPEGAPYHHDLENVHATGNTTIGLNLEKTMDSLTIYEDYYCDGILTTTVLTLQPGENGSFKLEPLARYDFGTQYAIYRIPYEGGEYVFRVDFT